MPEFQLIDEKRYPLKVEDFNMQHLPYYRWEHRATVGYNARDFIVYIDNGDGASLPKAYVEEIVGGHLEVVDDDALWTSLLRYVQEKELLIILPPMLKPGIIKSNF